MTTEFPVKKNQNKPIKQNLQKPNVKNYKES